MEVNQSRPLLRYPPAAHAAAPGTSLPLSTIAFSTHTYVRAAFTASYLARHPRRYGRCTVGGIFPANRVKSVEDFSASLGVPGLPPHPHSQPSSRRYPSLRRSSMPSVCTFILGDLKHFSFCMFSLITRSPSPDSFFCWSQSKEKRSHLVPAHFSL